MTITHSGEPPLSACVELRCRAAAFFSVKFPADQRSDYESHEPEARVQQPRVHRHNSHLEISDSNDRAGYPEEQRRVYRRSGTRAEPWTHSCIRPNEQQSHDEIRDDVHGDGVPLHHHVTQPGLERFRVSPHPVGEEYATAEIIDDVEYDARDQSSDENLLRVDSHAVLRLVGLNESAHAESREGTWDSLRRVKSTPDRPGGTDEHYDAPSTQYLGARQSSTERNTGARREELMARGRRSGVRRNTGNGTALQAWGRYLTLGCPRSSSSDERFNALWTHSRLEQPR